MPGPLVRVSLLYLTLTGVFPGVWAAFAPRSFYDDFPGAGLEWVAVDGPYNEHLVRDVGAFFLALGVVALAAAIASNVTLTRVAGAAWLVFAALHIAYHLRHLDIYDAPVLNVVALALPIGAAIVAVIGPARTGAGSTQRRA